MVNFGAATYKATEESNDAIVNIPVTLSATPGTDVTVPIVINNGSTATEGVSNDFILSTNSVTFKAGATGNDLTQNIAVTIKPDNIPENDETVILDFGVITAAAAGVTKQTTLTIAANDAVDYAVKAGVANIPEGNSGTTPITFTVTRSGGIDAASKVDFAIGGTATNNSDYKDIGGTSGATSTTGTITFAAGETQKTVTMNVVGETVFEPDETVIVNLSNPVAPSPTPTISTASATTTINNDDAPSSDSGGNSISAASGIAVASTTRTFSDWVGTADTSDYYKFSLGTSNNFSLSLNKLSANADVQLLNSSGNVIANSSNFGTTPESITHTLDQGSYYIHVFSVGDASTDYDLNLSVTPLISGITTTGSDAPIYIAGELISATNSPFIAPQDVESNSLIQMDKFRADPCFAGINGSGFSTVILDTGIDLNHPFFGPDNDSNGVADRIVYSYDYADGDADASDFNGHGSNVSSIVASQNATLTGMAPGSNIIHLKVFTNSGSGNFSFVEQALQWVVANAEKYNIASVNMSLGDSGNYNTPQTLYGISDELAQLAQKNAIVVSASGNSFYNFGSVQGIAYPSADPNSLSIGAVYDSNVGSFGYSNGAIANSTGSDRITPFSQRHQTLTTIFAPGAPITGAHYNGGTNIMHGTSQAAPHIAGIAVLAQQLAVKELGHRLTPSEFSNFLKSSGTTINDGDDENDNVINSGLNFKRVDMLALAKAIHVNQAPEEKIHLAGTNTYGSGVPIKDVFTDPDGDLLTYTATKSDGTLLPTWLQFSFNSNNNTITFTEVATPPSNWESFQVKLTATDPCSANASQTFWIVKQSSGWVIDGYIAGATIFFDANKNRVRDDNEPFTTTNNSGAYQLDIPPVFDTNNNGKFDPEEGYLVAFGGTDTATGLPLETPLVAPPSASVVTLLTSLVAELIDRGINPNTAESQVKAALSVTSDVNLTRLDPIAATNNKEPGAMEVLAAMVKVQNFITQTKGLIDGALGLPTNISTGKNDIVQGIVSALANQIQSGSILDFSNPEQLAVIIEASVNKAKQLSPTFNPVVNSEFIAYNANVMAQVNQHIDKIVTTNSPESIHQKFALVQKVALGEITSDFKASASGTKSINEVIAENTGSALNTQIQTARIPGVSAVPIINSLPNFDSTLLFDSDFYLAQYKDVADAVANKIFPDAFAHFSQFGWAEGRNPSSMFATDYLNNNSDVAVAIGQGLLPSGFAHFIKYGIAENRPGNSELTRLETFYLSQNSDVANAVSLHSLGSGIEHLIRFGWAEGRNPFTPFNIISETFDPTYYLARNQDVAEAIDRGFFDNAFEHFVRCGLFENRNPSELFDNTSYLTQYPDVAAAVKQGIVHSGFEHFVQHGMAEGRSLTRRFS